MASVHGATRHDVSPHRMVSALHVFATILIAGGCDAPEVPPTAAAPVRTLFAEITAELGLSGPPEVWPDGTYTLPEIMGGGVALFEPSTTALIRPSWKT